MSGGHFNYQEYAIKAIAEELEEYVSEGFTYTFAGEHYDRLEWVPEEYREEVSEEITLILNNLKKTYESIRSLDYLLSGDTGVGEFLKSCRNLRKL